MTQPAGLAQVEGAGAPVAPDPAEHLERGSSDGRPLAHEGDTVVGIDVHIVDVPSPAGPVPTPLPHPFKGRLDRELAASVTVEDKPAALEGSLATNGPTHVPQGGTFKQTPKDEAKVKTGSPTVLIEDKPAARAGDVCWTCSDPVDLPTGVVVASGTVVVGDSPPPPRDERRRR